MSVCRNKGDAIEGVVITRQARKYEGIVVKGRGAHRAVEAVQQYENSGKKRQIGL